VFQDADGTRTVEVASLRSSLAARRQQASA